MLRMPNNHRETSPIREAADQTEATNNGTHEINGGGRINSPVFEEWLINYRHQLAKVCEVKTVAEKPR